MSSGELAVLLMAASVIAFVAIQLRPKGRRRALPAERLAQPQGVPALDRLRTHWIVAVGGYLEGKTWWLGERMATLGRTPDNLIQVNEEAVSRTHCRIEPSGAGPVIIDLESSNGTHVNGRHISRTTLLDGDIILVGNQAFRYEHQANYVTDAAMAWKAAGGRVRLETQIGASHELQESIQESLQRHGGNVAAVTEELKIPEEMVQLLLGDDTE